MWNLGRRLKRIFVDLIYTIDKLLKFHCFGKWIHSPVDVHSKFQVVGAHTQTHTNLKLAFKNHI